MEPEVLSEDAYNMKANVYTFAIVLWEMLSLRTPYVIAKGRYHQLIDFVVLKQGRPYIEESWWSNPRNAQKQLCPDVKKRPVSVEMNYSRFDILSFSHGPRHTLSSKMQRMEMLWYTIIQEVLATL